MESTEFVISTPEFFRAVKNIRDLVIGTCLDPGYFSADGKHVTEKFRGGRFSYIMQFIELSLADKEAYNRFVAGHAGGSFLQSWEWGDWQAQLGRKVFRYKISDDSDSQIASVQLVKTPLPFGKYYLYSPYGPVGDSRFKIGDLRFLQLELQKIFKDAVFIRIEPKMAISAQLSVLSLPIVKTLNIQPAITMLLNLKPESEQILSAMHPKTRYNIKVAERDGVLVQHELEAIPQHGLYIQETVKLIMETQTRQRYHGHAADYYEKLIDFFSVQNPNGAVNLQIYRAVYQRNLLSCGIMIDFGKTRMYLFGGSSENSRNVMAPYMLHWQAMLDAKAMGLEYYDLGGSEVSGGGEKGFTRFKRGFGGQVVEYAGAYDIVINKSLYQVYRFLRSVNKIMKKTSPD